MSNIVVFGAGLFGITFARLMAEKGHEVTIYEKNHFVGGHIVDQNIDGTNVSIFGPHIFHTSDEGVWEFINRFTLFKMIKHEVRTLTDVGWLPWPINKTTIDLAFFDKASMFQKPEQCFADELHDAKSLVSGTFESLSKQAIGETLHNLTIKNYTEKMWGIPCAEVPAETFGRIRVVDSYDTSFFNDEHQGLPLNGYSEMCLNIIKHPNVNVVIGPLIDREFFYSSIRDRFDMFISTVAPDQFMMGCYGKLDYRSIEFMQTDKPSNFPTPVVNFGVDWLPFTRATDYKKLWGLTGDEPNVVVWEIPSDKGTQMYPIRTTANMKRAQKYIDAMKEENIVCAGRLGAFEYNDMAPTIRKAMNLAEELG